MSNVEHFKTLSPASKLGYIGDYLRDQNMEDFADFLAISVELKQDKKTETKIADTSFASKPLDDQKAEVLAFLKTKTEPTKTIEISKKFYGEKATRKDMNSLLYKMQGLNLITKTANDNGTDPKWSVKE